jgi:hypothetical protein
MDVFVQFADDAQARVVAEFSGPQDPEFYPHQAQLDANDARYMAFIALIGDLKEGGPALAERIWRDGEITRLSWLRDRHRDQLEIGVEPTLSAEQFNTLLVFLQALRDWPQSAAFPDTSARPVPPEFLEQMRGEQ